MKKVVTLGGGTGSFTVLTGLKEFPYELTSIISVTDSGGSTGKLRDEFGYLPVGDFRMALVALSESNGDNILRQLFLYRFDKGSGLAGHNFGNLFLTALTEILGSEKKAFEYASKILRVHGKVIPITNNNSINVKPLFIWVNFIFLLFYFFKLSTFYFKINMILLFI